MMGMTALDPHLILKTVATVFCAVGLVVLIRNMTRKDRDNLPPLRGKKSSFENASIITTVEGAAGMFFFCNICKEIEKERKDLEPSWSGALYRLSIPFIPQFIVCSDYKVARLVLEGDSSKDIEEAEKSTVVQQFDQFPGRHTIVSYPTSDPYRHATRKFLAQAFSMRNLAYAFSVVYEHLVAGSAVLDKKIASGETIVLGDFMLSLTLGAIIQSAFGAKLDTLSEDPNSLGAQYMRHLEVYLRVTASRLLTPWTKLMFWTTESKELAKSRAFRGQFAAQLAEAYRAKYPGSDFSQDGSIMGHLLRNEYRDERDLHSDMLVFISAGHETTAWSVTWLILEIARHPEVRKKLQAELDQHIPARRDADGNLLADVAFPSNAELFSLPYLSMCIKEAMRLWPVAATGPRRVMQRDLLVPYGAVGTGSSTAQPSMLLPKGATVQVNFFSMFRAGWIDRPEEFIPERWAPENPQLPRLKEMLMPFSLGRRNCIGQNLANVQLTMISAYLLRYYDFKLVSEPKLELFLTFKAQNVVMEVSHRP